MRDAEIRRLRRERPRSRFARGSLVALGALVVVAWVAGDFRPGALLTARSGRNLERFAHELVPFDLRGTEFGAGDLVAWAGGVLKGRGWQALLATLAISVAAVVLAGLAAALLSHAAARNLASPEPFLPAARRPHILRRAAWRALVAGTRLLLIFLRAIPEYVWAFLLLGLLGPGAWPAVLALALHNAGILGKLDAEVIENLDPAPMRALRGLGASRLQISLAAIQPAAFSRALLYLFYRWETCVREATVLGLLGVVSLGYYIQDANARLRYDEMALWILLGSAVILAGDLLSRARLVPTSL